MKILIAEDEITTSIIMKTALEKAKYNVTVVEDGLQALQALKKDSFDLLLTDWMMPNMDGIELIREIRGTIKPCPIIIVATSLNTDQSRSYALKSGADDFIGKPCTPTMLVSCIKECISRLRQDKPVLPVIREVKPSSISNFVGVGIVASTGGNPIIQKLIKDFQKSWNAAFFIVTHGPKWLPGVLSQSLQRATSLKVNIARENLQVKPGEIYIPPGDRHLMVKRKSQSIITHIDDGPKENFVRPSGDPTFRSMVNVFGQKCIGIVLTGLGRDGSLGCAYIKKAHGKVIVQDPQTATAPTMPKSVIDLGIVDDVLTVETIVSKVQYYIKQLC